MPCCEPVVTRICDGSHRTARTAPKYSAIASRKGQCPMASPYAINCLVWPREQRFTSFDHTSIGNCSSAGRLTRKGTRLFDQVCGATRIDRTRFEILRETWRRTCCLDEDEGDRFPMARNASSGIDLATQVPAPTNVSR